MNQEIARAAGSPGAGQTRTPKLLLRQQINPSLGLPSEQQWCPPSQLSVTWHQCNPPPCPISIIEVRGTAPSNLVNSNTSPFGSSGPLDFSGVGKSRDEKGKISPCEQQHRAVWPEVIRGPQHIQQDPTVSCYAAAVQICVPTEIASQQKRKAMKRETKAKCHRQTAFRAAGNRERGMSRAHRLNRMIQKGKVPQQEQKLCLAGCVPRH